MTGPLVIDECHHVLRSGLGRDIPAAIQALKHIVQSEHGVALIIAGVPGLKDAILSETTGETIRRFNELPLSRILPNSRGAASFGKNFEKSANMLGLNFAKEDALAERILFAERGQVGKCVALGKGILRAAITWLRARLDGRFLPGNSWMADQTLEQVLAASEMLGAILEHGHRVAVMKLSPEQTEEATDIGFSIYSEGPEAVSEALDTIRKMSPATAVQAGALAHYGQLYDWLHRRSNAIDPGPIRDILRDHIVKNSAVEPGTKVLGVEITERKYHTIQSLSAEVDIPRVRLSRVLKRLGQVPDDATEVDCGNAVFEAAKTVPMIEVFKSAVRLQDVPDYIGATKGQFEALYRMDIVKPLVPRTSRGSVRNVVFSKKHLDGFFAGFAGIAASCG